MRAAHHQVHRRYLGLLTLTIVAICLPLLGFAMLIDPLWHLRGNLVTGLNFPINERVAKLNLLLRQPNAFDCIIFGSSRSTLLPAAQLAPRRCFNLSFSGGRVTEFLAFARYLHGRGFTPRHVIVGVDGFNFRAGDDEKPSVPDFVLAGEPPPGLLRDYLTIDALVMAWRTLRGDFAPARYYDRQFVCRFSPRAPVYDPLASAPVEGLRRADAELMRHRPYVATNVTLYAELNAIFPGAEIVGYVPPISAWRVLEMERDGVLESYVDTLYAAARAYPRFVDFSVPSPETRQTANTYDGSHYSPALNARIAAALAAAPASGFGVDVKALSREAYRWLYRDALHMTFDQPSTPPTGRAGSMQP